jgi:hypothetical protein
MKVLFLDIDGVCNSEETMKRDYRKNGKGGILGIDPELAFIVGKIILNTNCKLVISSSWRHWPDGLEQIKSQIWSDIYGVTPNSKIGFRGDEVKAYLLEHPEITHYAILDDESDFHKEQPLFKTSFATGITPEIAKKVTDYLNAKEV